MNIITPNAETLADQSSNALIQPSVKPWAGWTQENIGLLKDLNSQGLTSTQIVAIMGGGLTRNAVIGKLHRLKNGSKPKQHAPKPKRMMEKPLPLASLKDNQCHWPLNNLYCAKECARGKVYCAEHMAQSKRR